MLGRIIGDRNLPLSRQMHRQQQGRIVVTFAAAALGVTVAACNTHANRAQASSDPAAIGASASVPDAGDDVSADELKRQVDSLIQDAKDRERAEAALPPPVEAPIGESASIRLPQKTRTDAPSAGSTPPPPVAAIQASREEDPTVVMTRRAETTFGPALTKSRALVDRFGQNFDRYYNACRGQTTQGGWAMTLADPYAPGGLSMFLASTTVDNETTPECRMLAVDLQADATRISRGLNAVAETARMMGVYPGVMRDLYDRYGVSGAVAAVVR